MSDPVRTCEHCAQPASGTIALFGGSFDPPHRGHVAVAEAVAALEQIDQLWWLPCPSAPHKARALSAPAERLAWCRAAARERQQVCAADLTHGTGRTLDLVSHLRRRHPGARLLLVIGADQAAALPSWHGVEALLEKVGLVVADRPGHPAPRSLELPAGTLHVRVGAGASSTDVRAGRTDLLPAEVARLWTPPQATVDVAPRAAA